MNADQIKSQYEGYRSWNDPAAIVADFKATGGQGKGGPSTSSSSSSGGFSSNAIDLAKTLNQYNVDAAKPAIQSLQASIPEISSKFSAQRTALEAEKTPLQDRYANLISTLKGNQTTEEQRQTLATSNNFSKRGIPLSSGVYEQSLTNAVNPITSKYSGLIKDTGLQQESDLRSISNLISTLTGQEVDSTRAVSNAIAQLQAGNPSSSLTSAIGLLSQQQQAEIAKQQLAQQQAQQAFDNKIKEATLANDTTKTKYDVGKPYYESMATGAGGSSAETAALNNIFGSVKGTFDWSKYGL